MTRKWVSSVVLLVALTLNAADATGYAQLKILEEQILAARRELDDRLEAIMRAKSGFENWMDLEVAHARKSGA